MSRVRDFDCLVDILEEDLGIMIGLKATFRHWEESCMRNSYALVCKSTFRTYFLGFLIEGQMNVAEFLDLPDLVDAALQSPTVGLFDVTTGICNDSFDNPLYGKTKEELRILWAMRFGSMS